MAGEERLLAGRRVFTFRVAGEPAEPCEENRRASEPPKRVPLKRVLPTQMPPKRVLPTRAPPQRVPEAGGGEVPMAR